MLVALGCARTFIATAISVTSRAIGPTTSRDGVSGQVPVGSIRPAEVFSPTSSSLVEGTRIDPPVSPPMANIAKLADTAAPGPELDPPGVTRGSYGLSVRPYESEMPLYE